MSAMKIGVIGAGAISKSHCSGAASHADAELAAIADSNESRAEDIRAEFKIPKKYSSIDEILADKDIDAISIALPTFLHAPAAIQALKAGKHVLLDKPFAMNKTEAANVIETAKSAGKVLCVGMNQRFAADSQTIRTIADRGDLGEIYHGRAYWLRRAGIPKLGTWFGSKAKSGGGALLDIGVHAMDLCLSLMGNFEPETVSGFSHTKFGNRGLGEGGWGKSDREETVFDVDDFSGALIKLRGGATLQLEVSWARHQESSSENNVELFGTEGGAQVYPAKVFRYSQVPGEYEVVEPQGVNIKYPHCDRVQNWIDAILGKAELECKPEQSLAVQKIIDGIYESAKSGREVVIS
ncbi:MAG: Gfo/Idh/MocA family oxidoreductase [Spirochaetales bacterium]|nr:Gfo/Idh/MocA family oxidoreductase [Spirochaetales bacterium]